MAKIRPYVALDIETTGLDVNRSHVLQIAAVLDDGVKPIEELERIIVFVKNDPIIYGELYALGMNGWIFEEIKKSIDGETPKYPVANLEQAIAVVEGFMNHAATKAYDFQVSQNSDKPRREVQVAGKNVGQFDLEILKRQAILVGKPDALKSVSHRTIDVGAVYFDMYGRNPGLNTINKVTGRSEVSHDALSDCLDVVQAIRHKMAISDEFENFLALKALKGKI